MKARISFLLMLLLAPCLAFADPAPDGEFANVPVVVNGTAGSYSWSMPIRSADSKKVVVSFDHYTNAAQTSIVFPVPFTSPPRIMGNGTHLLISPPTASSITIPSADAVSGFLTLEGH